MKAGISIDAWKLPIFKKALAAAGFNYEVPDGPLAACVTLSVECSPASAQRLALLVSRTNQAATRSRMH